MKSRRLRNLFSRFGWFGLMAGGLAAVPCTAQAPAKPSAPTVPAASLRQGFGVNDVDGALWGGGPDYKVRFAPDEVEFTPALGRAAAHNLPLTFSTLSIGRGADAQPVTMSAPRRVGAATVEFDRAPGVFEHHEVRAGGVELTFEFASRPAGAGDLVVRLQLRSELPLELGADGLRCEQPGLGGVGVGLVTGRDAAGHSAPGELRLDGDVLELALPAEFVDTAALPLVLDPFVFPVIPLAVNSLFQEWLPDVAYEAAGGKYLAVWTKLYSDWDFDVRGQFLDANGAADPNGYWLIETATTTRAWLPAVASLASSGRFMVVWGHEDLFLDTVDLRGRSVSALGLGMSSIIVVDGNYLDDLSVDIGGHSSPAVDVVTVIWDDRSQVLHRNVTVPFAGDPSAVGSTQALPGLASDGVEDEAISKSGGDSHWLMVVANRFESPPAGGNDSDIQGWILNEFGDVVWGPELIAGTSAFENSPDVDGDGQVFFTVFTSQQSQPFSSYTSVHATRTVLGPGGAGFNSIETTIDDPTPFDLNASGPCVAFTGNGALVAWSKQYDGQDYDVALVGLDPWANTIADPHTYADFDTTTALVSSVCAKYSANHSLGDGALCAWQVAPDTFVISDKDALVAAIDPELGIVTDLGGATALGGKAGVSAATVGNTGFTHFYDGLYGFNPVTLVIGASAISAPFCTGKLVPQPTYMLHLATKADSTLVLPTPMPAMPALLGFTFYEQYVESDPFTSPCGKNLQLSNGLSIKIE